RYNSFFTAGGRWLNCLRWLSFRCSEMSGGEPRNACLSARGSSVCTNLVSASSIRNQGTQFETLGGILHGSDSTVKANPRLCRFYGFFRSFRAAHHSIIAINFNTL